MKNKYIITGATLVALSATALNAWASGDDDKSWTNVFQNKSGEQTQELNPEQKTEMSERFVNRGGDMKSKSRFDKELTPEQLEEFKQKSEEAKELRAQKMEESMAKMQEMRDKQASYDSVIDKLLDGVSLSDEEKALIPEIKKQRSKVKNFSQNMGTIGFGQISKNNKSSMNNFKKSQRSTNKVEDSSEIETN